MKWALDNPRIARAISRWAGAIEREAPRIASQDIRDFVKNNLDRWDGSQMPLSRSWVEDETESLSGHDRDLARFALIVAKSAPQMDERLIKRVYKNEKQFIRALAWASFSGARRVAAIVAMKTGASTSNTGDQSTIGALKTEPLVQSAGMFEKSVAKRAA